MDSSIQQEKTNVSTPITVPTRICQTCGVAKSLDHFVSLYTEASTTNCDACRKKQREVYRRMFKEYLINCSETAKEEKA